jgi:hypothetical protein
LQQSSNADWFRAPIEAFLIAFSISNLYTTQLTWMAIIKLVGWNMEWLNDLFAAGEPARFRPDAEKPSTPAREPYWTGGGTLPVCSPNWHPMQ